MFSTASSNRRLNSIGSEREIVSAVVLALLFIRWYRSERTHCCCFFAIHHVRLPTTSHSRHHDSGECSTKTDCPSVVDRLRFLAVDRVLRAHAVPVQVMSDRIGRWSGLSQQRRSVVDRQNQEGLASLPSAARRRSSEEVRRRRRHAVPRRPQPARPLGDAWTTTLMLEPIPLLLFLSLLTNTEK